MFCYTMIILVNLNGAACLVRCSVDALENRFCTHLYTSGAGAGARGRKVDVVYALIRFWFILGL